MFFESRNRDDQILSLLPLPGGLRFGQKPQVTGCEAIGHRLNLLKIGTAKSAKSLPMLSRDSQFLRCVTLKACCRSSAVGKGLSIVPIRWSDNRNGSKDLSKLQNSVSIPRRNQQQSTFDERDHAIKYSRCCCTHLQVKKGWP